MADCPHGRDDAWCPTCRPYVERAPSTTLSEPWRTSVANAPHWKADLVLAGLVMFFGWITKGDPGWLCPIAGVLAITIFRLLSARQWRLQRGIRGRWESWVR